MEVNVDKKTVQEQVKMLKDSLQGVNILYKELKNQFQDMQSWNDSKSQEAKAIVAFCGKDIQKMGKSISQAIENLEKILKPLAEYENANLYSGNTSSTVESSCVSETNDSQEYIKMRDMLNSMGVEYRPIQMFVGERTENDIIRRISGGDMTAGSCSSLALAYAGNVAGYDVLDFRDGSSRDYFSSRSTIELLTSLPGVNATVFNGRNDIESVNQLLNNMIPGRTYYLATGQHASVVRRNGERFEYLELQHPSYGNGWHDLDNSTLEHRFRARTMRLSSASNYLVEINSLANNREFLNILGYINTAENAQRRGVNGNVR